MFGFNADTLKHLLTNVKNKFSTIEEMNNKVDKIENKSLSSNNLSDAEVSNINSSLDNTEVINNLNGATISFYSTSVNGASNKIKEIELDV